jgi:hypothetical protein
MPNTYVSISYLVLRLLISIQHTNDEPPRGKIAVFHAIPSGDGFEFVPELIPLDPWPIGSSSLPELPPLPLAVMPAPGPAPTYISPLQHPLPLPLLAPPLAPPVMAPPVVQAPRMHSKSANLTRWFKPALSEDVVRADRVRMDLEHKEKMDTWRAKDKAVEEQRKAAKTEDARERQGRKRQRDKEADIEAGRRDLSGRPIKLPPPLPVGLLLSQPPSSSLNVAEASRPKRSLREQERQQRGKVGRPRTTVYKEALQTNWMSPLLWTHIERAAKRCSPKMSPTEICRELQKLDPVLFKVLRPQTLRKWIDTKGEWPTWSEKTLERVEAAYSPGGLTTRVGVLVSFSIRLSALHQFLAFTC